MSPKSGSSLLLSAHAKINLFLSIGPRRPDGYHDLQTVFQEISLHDTLSFHKTAGPIALSCSDPNLSAGPDNLIVRALTAVRQRLKTKAGAGVHLQKEVPIGAGLGGGSSDAAAAIRA